mgnify:CR=1 FL=1
MSTGSQHKERQLNARTLGMSGVSAAGLWLLFIASSINAHELIVGAFCACATIVFSLFVSGTAGVPFELRLIDLAKGWRVPWYILQDAWIVTVALVKDVLHIRRAGSLFHVCGFETSKHDPVRIARTVLAVAYSTCSPNTIVIGIDQTQSRMLFHQISRSSMPKMTRSLGAKG